ncbi:hypothetical protein KM043_016064 [Ampulex compressa]|nr:hypothetical protein KM043_016064 [Ampulex compressa]
MLSTPKAKSGLFLASALCDGLEDNDIKQVITLLNKDADPNVLIPSQGVTPFHLIVGNDCEIFAEKVTKLFLRHGGDPNVRSIDGLTPVHVAAAWGRCGILELLLVNGGDPLCVDDEGRNPFHYAFDGKYYNVVAILGKYCENALPEKEENTCNIVFDKLLINNGCMMAEYVESQNASDSLTNKKSYQRQKNIVEQSMHCSQSDLGFGNLWINGSFERQTLVDQCSPPLSPDNISLEENSGNNLCTKKSSKSYTITKLRPMVPSWKTFQKKVQSCHSPTNNVQCSVNTSIVSRSPNFPSFNKHSTPGMDIGQEFCRFAQSTPRRRKRRIYASITKQKHSTRLAWHLQKQLLDSEDSLDDSSVECDRVFMTYKNETELLERTTFMKSKNDNSFTEKKTSTVLGRYTGNNNLQQGTWNSEMIGDFNVSGVEELGRYDSEDGKDLEKEVNVDEIVKEVGNVKIRNMENKYFDTFKMEKICKAEEESCSTISIQEEYKYEDPKDGIMLLERRLCMMPNNTAREGTDATSIISDSSKIQSLPTHLLYIQDASLRRRLVELGDSPGPVTSFTRRIYLKRLLQLESKCAMIPCIKKTPHIRADLALGSWTYRLQKYAELEKSAFSDFVNPKRRWREGVVKMSFNYLLLDSRITLDLPHRASSMTHSEIWETFLSAIFYSWVSKDSNTSTAKVKRILEIWNMGYGVVCLHVYQNTIPVEAYTREAVMIDALGLEWLCNSKGGELYGVVATWNIKERCKLGRYLLYKAMLILMHEGERQLFPEYL